MRKAERAEIIIKELKKLYPSPPIPLDHTNSYTLLVAVVLSAQSTDKKVNELTKSLFKVADNPEKMMQLGINGIYEYIKFLGLFLFELRYRHLIGPIFELTCVCEYLLGMRVF